MGDSPSVRLQTVVYGNNVGELKRSLCAAVNSLRRAQPAIGDWTIAIGDSSAEPVLSADQVEDITAMVQESRGVFEYQFFGENLGHGGGHNRLQMQAEADFLLIVNPDGLLAPDTVKSLIRCIQPDVGIVDARQIPLEHPKAYNPNTWETSWCSLACAMTPLRAFREVGGIDHSSFFMYCDDVDYSWRLRLAGYRARYCPQARMFHDKRLDLAGQMNASETERYYSIEAAMLLAYKYSRDDVLEHLQHKYLQDGEELALRAVEEFQRRQSAGRLPERIDKGHRVAQFSGGTYGAHRF